MTEIVTDGSSFVRCKISAISYCNRSHIAGVILLSFYIIECDEEQDGIRVKQIIINSLGRRT